MSVSLPSVRYGDRPAFGALVACLVGLWLALSGWLLWGSVALAVLTAGLWAAARQRRWAIPSFLLLLPLLAVAYGLYARARSFPQRSMPAAVTLYDTEVRVDYPVAASLESAIRYHATLVEEGLPILLTLPGGREELYGVVLRGDLDLASLAGGGTYRRYLLGEGYVAQGYGQSLVPTGRRSYTLRSRLMEGRSRLVRRFEQATGERLGYADRGLVYALCLGERLHLPREVKEGFTTAGVAHILAVSGYHLGVVFGLVAGLLGLLLPGYRHRRLRYGLILAVLFLYTLVTGASMATVRALVMSSIYLVARIAGRRADPIQVLSLTLLFFLLRSPYALCSVGLILSVSAVWGLMLFMPLLDCLVQPSVRLLRSAWSSIAACLSAQIGVLPWLFLFFGTAAGSTLWCTLPIVLLSGLLIPAGLLSLGWVGLFGRLPGVVITLLGFLSRAMRQVTDLFATPEASLAVTMEYDGVLVVLYYGIVLLLYDLVLRYLRRRRQSIR